MGEKYRFSNESCDTGVQSKTLLLRSCKASLWILGKKYLRKIYNKNHFINNF
jgi:hypothetical protein